MKKPIAAGFAFGTIVIALLIFIGRERHELIEFGGITWRVLDVQGDRALIISEYILANRRYHYRQFESTTWETSNIRQYLNGPFLNRFSEDERARILETNLINYDNPWFGTRGGGDTTDKVFLLSLEELVRYFGDSGYLSNWSSLSHPLSGVMTDRFNSARIASFYSRREGSSWWLRSPGDSPIYPAHVSGDGVVSVRGFVVVWHVAGVRPALWLALEPGSFEPVPYIPQARIEANIGETIEFGGIVWRVLDVQGSSALVISEFVLESRRYNDQYEDITWAESTIRQYLNGSFLRRFSEAEQARIWETTVINNDNPRAGTSGGEDTTDKIFLLSFEELLRYFGDSGQLENKDGRPSVLGIDDEFSSARASRRTDGRAASWWLRSPGYRNTSAATVNTYGVVGIMGSRVALSGVGIRPALWLNLEP